MTDTVLNPEEKPTRSSSSEEEGHSGMMQYISLLLMVWDTVQKNRSIVITVFIGCMVYAIAYAFLATPVYKSDIMFSIIVSDKSMGGGLGDIASLTGIGGGGERGDAITILSSRVLVDLFIQKNNLMPVLFEDQWDSEEKHWKSDKPPTQAAAYRLFTKTICGISEERKTGIVTLSIRWKDPIIATEWANKFVQEADFIRRKDAIDDAKSSLTFLESELRKTSVVELQKIIQQLMEAQIKKNMMANTASRYTYKIIDPATVPDLKEFPKKKLIFIFGIIFGSIFSILTPFFIKFMGDVLGQIRISRIRMSRKISPEANQ